MKGSSRLAAPLLIGLALVSLAAIERRPAAAETKTYVCPPCGLPCDAATYDHPGACPKCGMTLVDRDTLTANAAARKTVAILIFDGVQIIDYTGPYEIFQAADFDVFTVAATKAPVTTVAGMTVVPKYSFADAPPSDILVVPGGGIRGALDDAATVGWVRERALRSPHTISVCNGAFILAKAGLLDGLTVTTTFGNIPRLRAEYPKTRVVDDRRYVDNGKIVTTGGLTAGIDGALHLVALLRGKGTAEIVALGEEYDWHPAGGFVRGALADTNFEPWIDETLVGVGSWHVVASEGGTENWTIAAEGTSELAAAQLVDQFGKVCASRGKWTRVEAAARATAEAAEGRWTFTGRDGAPWAAVLTVARLPAGGSRYSVTLAIARVGSDRAARSRTNPA